MVPAAPARLPSGWLKYGKSRNPQDLRHTGKRCLPFGRHQPNRVRRPAVFCKLVRKSVNFQRNP